MMGLKRDLPLRSKHSSHSINKNITGMALPLAASCWAGEAEEACPVFSMQHPSSLLAALRLNPLPQDFQEHYVQTGPGRLFVGSTQRFLHDSLPASLRCNHSIQYDEARGPQPQLVQHLRASAISSAFDPEAEALRFQLTTALQAGEALLPQFQLRPVRAANVTGHLR